MISSDDPRFWMIASPTTIAPELLRPRSDQQSTTAQPYDQGQFDASVSSVFGSLSPPRLIHRAPCLHHWEQHKILISRWTALFPPQSSAIIMTLYTFAYRVFAVFSTQSTKVKACLRTWTYLGSHMLLLWVDSMRGSCFRPWWRRSWTTPYITGTLSLVWAVGYFLIIENWVSLSMISFISLWRARLATRTSKELTAMVEASQSNRYPSYLSGLRPMILSS